MAWSDYIEPGSPDPGLLDEDWLRWRLAQLPAEPTRQTPAATQQLTMPSSSFRPAVQTGGGLLGIPGGPMSAEQADAMRKGSLDLFSQASLLGGGSPVASAEARVLAQARPRGGRAPPPPSRAGSATSPAEDLPGLLTADTGGVVSGNLLGMVRAYHGSPNEMAVLDPTRVGTGAMADRWAQGVKHSDEYYLTTSKAHAKDYGDIVHEFEINHPLLEKDAKADLENWAKDEGYPSAQQHINDYYDGSAYHALDADNYFKDALREAKEAGLPGARISFGDLFSRQGRSKVPIGDVIVLHDPSVAVKVPPPAEDLGDGS